jgi:beta-lactamase regulating signal transducer with metallopeptidase domain
MQPYFMQLLSAETIQVLFWTLIHSLWQGIVFAFFTAIILTSTKKSNTSLRYKLLSATLLLFVITSLLTLGYELYEVNNNTQVLNNGLPVVAYTSSSVNNFSLSFIEKIIALLQPYESIIVLAWFVVIALKSVSLLNGLRNTYGLKHKNVFDAGEYWNNQIKLLAKKTGIKKPVVLLKSFVAEVPMVIGYFKPVILFPASALTALAPAEIEAILLHELAHIYRKDFLINILQRITEIIFFFNPAVLWISFLIKEERENCCDDIAVRETKNKKQFIHALVSFQEHNASGYAPSFSGRKNFLLNRVKRIITNNNKTLSNMEKTFLMCGIIVTTLTAFAFAQHKQSFMKNASIAQTAKPAIAAVKDTVPTEITVNDDESKYTISTTMDGKQYRLVEINGKVMELYINNVRIPDNKISNYNSVIDTLQKKLKADKEAQKEAMEAQKEALKAQAEEMKGNQLAMNDKLAKLNEDMAKQKDIISKEQAEKLKEKMNEKEIIMKEQAEKFAEIAKQKSLMLNDKQMKDFKEQAEKFKEMAKQNNDLIKTQTEVQAKAMKLQAEKFAEDAKKYNEIIKTQVEQQTKMIKDKTDKLINEELKKQIEELQQQNEELKLQLNQRMDSIRKSPANIPQGA